MALNTVVDVGKGVLFFPELTSPNPIPYSRADATNGGRRHGLCARDHFGFWVTAGAVDLIVAMVDMADLYPRIPASRPAGGCA